jgi:5-methylcytosine-specific restriction endonuclease McrA
VTDTVEGADMESVPTKVCTECKSLKALTDFYSDRSRPDGLMYRCKDCLTKYRATNKDRIKVNNRTYRQRHAEQVREWDRAKHLANRDANNARSRAYYQANMQAVKDANRAWLLANRSKVREFQRQAQLRRRARRNGLPVFEISKKDMRRLLGSPCAVEGCMNTDIQIDHVIPIARGGGHGIGNLQSLCKSHNSSKRDRMWMEFRMYLRRSLNELKTA